MLGKVPQYNMAQIFFAEFIGTFCLASTVLNAGTSADYEGNSFFGLAIGGALTIGVLTLGGISGAVFNPAVGILAFFTPVHSDFPVPPYTWVYFVAPPLAAALAALGFRFVSPKDHAPREALMHGPVDHVEHHVSSSKIKSQGFSRLASDETVNS